MGRCDYWGPFVNRAARFGNAAAHGARSWRQQLLPATKLVQFLTGQVVLGGSEPVLLAQPDFVPQRLKLPSAGEQTAGSSLVALRSSRFRDLPRTPEVAALAEHILTGLLPVTALHAAWCMEARLCSKAESTLGWP